MSGSYFEWYQTKTDGTPLEEARRIPYADVRVIILQWKYSMSDIVHFIDLACTVPGTPIDVTHWESGALVFSARLVYHLGDEESAPLDKSATRLIRAPRPEDF